MKLQDPRKIVKVDLPTYKDQGAFVEMYTTLRPKETRQMQDKYNDVMISFMKNNMWWVDKDKIQEVVENADHVNIGRMSEMSAYTIFLHIKSWNIDEELTFDNFNDIMYDADIEAMTKVISEEDEKKKKEKDMSDDSWSDERK